MSWMRQKSEPEASPRAQPAASSTPASTPARPATTTPASAAPASTVANVGQSVQIKGELSGNEDLVIEGRVEGQVKLPQHKLTIGAGAKIQAEVSAKTVIVLGEVTGNITASDVVDISPSGSVDGDITAPRVAIADGARFRGKIDMQGRKAASESGSRGTGSKGDVAVAS